MLSGAIVNTGGGQHRQLMMRPDGRCYVIPNSTNMSNSGEYDEQPVSRTYQYRKVMKPMLERKRRARINRCLDELKELMLTALQSEGENVSKLEKADILELTVRHLHKLKRQRALGLSTETTYTDRFLDGFTHCTSEVSHYLASVMQSPTVEQTVKIPEPVIDRSSGIQLLQHLGSCIQRIEHASYNGHDDSYTNPYSTPPPSPSPNLSSTAESNKSISPPPTTVWRPW